ncbi:Clavaminate synthase-like protein [Macrolepiota fuliginosa MF-IS2]|uniref:Clavaminate synthase-like protein n=1 Tax=Macrolepiota fuliginosa MF-IS2 TaxID=1400762 RepID=A0A9P6C3Z2_9AGAR|nr:Clavaminate synthase-like protein [Macrolepiota fuliginosa MF-IS2]
MNFREILTRDHPEPLRPFLPEIDAFAKHAHINIFDNLLRIIAMTLGLDEGHFVKLNDHSAEAETFLRFVKYFPRPEEDEQKSQNVWLKGHTDFVSLTLLFSQPVSALQIMTKDGKWKWVKHIDNAIVVNIGDAIEFFSGGYYQSTIHRVRQPPDDQRNHPRVGVIYFITPHDDVELEPVMESPLVQRADLGKLRFVGGEVPTMEKYRKSRVMNYGGLQALRPGLQEGVEVEDLGGVVVQHYN